jgi:predicted aconitase
MTMILTKEEEAMASGKFGPGIAKCMNILKKFGEALGAEKMVKLSSAHTMPKEPPELLKEMTEGVNQTGTFTTLHALMSAFDPHLWRKMGISEGFASKELPLHEQRLAIYRRLGFYETYTCLPMLVGNLPRRGDFISWIGSCAQLFVNSLLGARTNRDGGVVNLAAAITGRAPYRGLFLDENRFGQVLVELDGLNPYQLTYTDLSAIGYYVGGKAQDRNVVINGLPKELDMSQMLGLLAPLPASGSVCLCHMVGLTPEASTLEGAFGNRKPTEVIKVGKKAIAETKALHALNQNEKVDMVVLGCPHCTIQELKKIASLLDGKKIGNGRRLWIGSPYQMYYLAQTMGYSQIIENAGGVISSSCMATIPDSPIPEDVKIIATNSFKASHYISRLTKGRVKLVVQEMDECIHAILS